MAPPISRVPAEISNIIIDYLSREDLFCLRFVNQRFAAYATVGSPNLKHLEITACLDNPLCIRCYDLTCNLLQKRLFEVIPIWFNMKCLRALASLSECSHLRGHVKHIVVSALCFREPRDESAYLARFKTYFADATDDPSVSNLWCEHSRLTYHTSV